MVCARLPCKRPEPFPHPPRVPSKPSPHSGFTLIEVLVALAIVAIALLAGGKAMNALTQTAGRQSDVMLAQICAENQLIAARLSQQLPGLGNTSVACEQAGRLFDVRVGVFATPNPDFRRIDAHVFGNGAPLLRLSTIVGRY